MSRTAANRPPIPLAPVLSGATFRRAHAGRTRTVLDAGPARLVTSARVAIALALRELGVAAGDEVLVPAYHSPSMVGPVRWRGASPVFYKVREDASVDLADVAARLSPSTRALMVTHYFGFPQQEIDTIRTFCDVHGIALIEDCAHCFIGEHRGRPVGSWGDYAVASTMKFFPVYEGGVLVSARHSLERVRLRAAGAAFEAKIAFNSLERGFVHGRLRALWLPLRLKDAAWSLLRRRGGAPLAPSSSDSSVDFDPAWLDKRSSLFTRAVLRLAPAAGIARARQANYRRLHAALAGLPGGRPLFEPLPDGACPWVFPYLANDPERLLARVQAGGVPVTRFAHGTDTAGCAASATLAQRVLCFPCHQELADGELAHMIAIIRRALA